MVVEEARKISTDRKIELLAKELGVDFQALIAEDTRRKIAEEAAREAARVEAERQAAEAEAARLRDTLARHITAGIAVAFVDGNHVQRLECPDGGEMALTPVALKVQHTRQILVNMGRRFPGEMDASAGGAAAGERVISVPCTCEKGAHEIRLFVSSAPIT